MKGGSLMEQASSLHMSHSSLWNGQALDQNVSVAQQSRLSAAILRFLVAALRLRPHFSTQTTRRCP